MTFPAKLFQQARVIGLLQIHPELSGGVEKRRETYRSIARDASRSFENFFHEP